VSACIGAKGDRLPFADQLGRLGDGMTRRADHTALLVDIAAAGTSLAAIALWLFLGMGGYIMHAGPPILAAPPVVLSALTYGTVRLALRGHRRLALVPAAAVVVSHLFLIRLFLLEGTIREELFLRSAGVSPLPAETVLRNVSVSALASLSIFLVVAAFVVPRRRAAV
jgi:hypothetical protein